MGVLSRTKREARARRESTAVTPLISSGGRPTEYTLSARSRDLFSAGVVQLVSVANGVLDQIDTSMFRVDWVTIVPERPQFHSPHNFVRP